MKRTRIESPWLPSRCGQRLPRRPRICRTAGLGRGPGRQPGPFHSGELLRRGLPFNLAGIDTNGSTVCEHCEPGDACTDSSVCKFSRNISAVPEPASALLTRPGRGARVAGGAQRFRGGAAAARPWPTSLTLHSPGPPALPPTRCPT